MRALTIIVFAAGALRAAGNAGSFAQDVAPLLAKTCSACHNEKLSSGGLNIALFSQPASLTANRDSWERIAAKVRNGEMPPKGIPKPPAAQIDAFLKFVQSEFNRADAKAKSDPGHVTAHRLNRVEYANTIRDLLGFDYRAQEEFPADDSGYGFDNIGDVLTVSPTLMQKYLSAAESIAMRAVGGDPLPKPGLFNRRNRVRRLDTSHIVLKDIIEYDAEYTVRALLVGHRGPQDKPVTLVISVDGKPIKTVSVPVQISAVNQQGGATHRVSEEARVYLPDGEHTFSAEFVNDDAVKELPLNARFNNNRNMYPDVIEVAGPFPPSMPHPVQKKALLCDPDSGAACIDRILSTLARRAYRRPAGKAEVASLQAVFDKAKAAGCTPHQALQFAVTSLLVSPQFLFRIERDPKGGAAARISDLELASRLSYFLWSSMPDDELLRLGETNKLHAPAVLEAQMKRLIADPRSSAFAENFIGQWLETRSLDAVSRDPKKFPEWNTELKEAMRTETRMFVEAMLREDRPLTDLIDGKYTFLNENLAKHYGIQGVTGPEFRRVELTGDQRSGVFTQGSVLTVAAYPTRTSVVLRGKYLLENVLNAPPPPPPPDVPLLNEEAVGTASSLRQQMEQHRADPTCAACHAKMDVLGFALENYDAIGRWRTEDGKFKVDSTGEFPNGKTFASPAEMKVLLLENMPEFAHTIAEKMLTYSLGRGVEPFDRVAVRDLVRQTAEKGYSTQALVLGIVRSVPFQQRRGELAAQKKPEIAQP